MEGLGAYVLVEEVVVVVVGIDRFVAAGGKVEECSLGCVAESDLLFGAKIGDNRQSTIHNPTAYRSSDSDSAPPGQAQHMQANCSIQRHTLTHQSKTAVPNHTGQGICRQGQLDRPTGSAAATH